MAGESRPRVRVAVDVCMGKRGLELLRAGGHDVAVVAAPGESDRDWFGRAVAAGVDVVISGDSDLAALAHDAGVAIFVPLRSERDGRVAERFLRRYGGAVEAAGTLPQRDADRSRFADDHVCESLRGHPVPTLPQARRALVHLVKHLERSISRRVREGEPVSMEVAELAAIVMLVEHAESRGADG